MINIIRGRAWLFGNDVNTDVITPGKYENLPMPEMVRHCLEPINPDFAGKAADGDMIVAGENFGCGSAREIAPAALKTIGLGGVIAKSFSRTFYRNAIAIGFPAIVSQAALGMCREGDILEMRLDVSRLWNQTAGLEISIEPFDSLLYEILIKGGIFSKDLCF